MDFIFKCFLCEKEFKQEKIVISHLKLDHFVKENTIEIKCVVKGKSCSAGFYTYSSLKSHMKKCLQNAIKIDVCNVNKQTEKELNFSKDVSSHRMPENNYFSLENINILQAPSTEEVNSNTFQFESGQTENPDQFCEETMAHFLNSFNSEMCNLKLNHSQITAVFKLCADLVENTHKLNQHLIDKPNGLDISNALQMSTTFITSKLKDCSTKYKREKYFSSNELYVAPSELTIGLRYDMSRKGNSVTVPRLIPCKYHYIPITSTIFSLFQRDDFRKEYFKFNAINAKNSIGGVYSEYSCGSLFKSNELFSAHPNSLQIELATDDVDICNAIGSKATMHKLCPVYVSIKNIPPQFTSRLDAISLASLSYSNDMHTKYTDFNGVWRPIVNDISCIEDGIDIGGEIIRGTVTFVASDNLGQNTALGFVKNFRKTEYCCRFCN